MIVLINSSDCNPEPKTHYSHLHEVDPSVPYEMRVHNSDEIAPEISKEEAISRISSFEPANVRVREMYSVME